MRNLFLSVAITAALLTTAAKAETINCTEITVVPFVITAQGVYCLKRDQSSALTTGNIIDIQTNNVTIDLNGFKLGGLGAGPDTLATGIHAQNRQNITIRNGSLRGFQVGLLLEGSTSSGDMVESLLLDGSTRIGIQVEGWPHVVRNNRVVNTGITNLSQTFGVSVVDARNSVIADNVVSSTWNHLAGGVHIGTSSLIELRNNTILDTRDGQVNRGVEIASSTDVTVINNRVLNAAAAPGTDGIIASSSTGISCIDNTVAGFTTALTGCDFSIGNNTP